MKFEIKESGNAFSMWIRSSKDLFRFGNTDILISKRDEMFHCSYCQQNSFNYHGIKHALRGKCGQEHSFIVKRIFVIQMN